MRVIEKTTFLCWLPTTLLVFQAGGHSQVIWGHSNLAFRQRSFHDTGASSLKSRPEWELLKELVLAGPPSWAWHHHPSPISLIQGWGVRPSFSSPYPKRWLAISLLLQFHPPPAILLPGNSHLSPFRLPLLQEVHWADSPLGFTLNFSWLCVFGVLPWPPTMEVRAMNWQLALTETHFLLPQTRAARTADRTSHGPSTCAPWHRGPYCPCPCPMWALSSPEDYQILLTRSQEVEIHMQRVIRILLCHPRSNDF